MAYTVHITVTALLEIENGFEQIGSTEVGPQRIGDVDLGIGDLPQQKIADAHFARRSDEQVGIGRPGRVEVCRDRLLIESQTILLEESLPCVCHPGCGPRGPSSSCLEALRKDASPPGPVNGPRPSS